MAKAVRFTNNNLSLNRYPQASGLAVFLSVKSPFRGLASAPSRKGSISDSSIIVALIRAHYPPSPPRRHRLGKPGVYPRRREDSNRLSQRGPVSGLLINWYDKKWLEDLKKHLENPLSYLNLNVGPWEELELPSLEDLVSGGASLI